MKFYQRRFEPTPEDEYFMEIKACYKALRRTNPEKYVDFAKSVLNEYFNMNELVKNLKNHEIYSFFIFLIKINILEKNQNALHGTI